MADLTLDTTQRAKVVDPDTGEQLGAVGQEIYHINSDDNAVAFVNWLDWRPWVYAVGVGTATITAERLADGAIVTKTVEVVAAPPPPPFDIGFSAPEPKP